MTQAVAPAGAKTGQGVGGESAEQAVISQQQATRADQEIARLMQELEAMGVSQEVDNSATSKTETKTYTDAERKKIELAQARLDALREVAQIEQALGRSLQKEDLNWIHGELNELSGLQKQLASWEKDGSITGTEKTQVKQDITYLTHVQSRLAEEAKRIKWDMMKDTSAAQLSSTDKLSLLLTGRTLDQLKQADQQEFAKKMWLVSQYIEDNGKFSELTGEEQAKIRALKTDAEKILGQQQDATGKRILDKLHERYDKQEHVWDAKDERTVLEFFSDPNGELRQGKTPTEYAKQITELITQVKREMSELAQFLHQKAKEIASGKINLLAQNDLEQISEFETDQQKLSELRQKIQARSREEARTRLKANERQQKEFDLSDARDMLVGIYGDTADPELFIQQVEARLEQMKDAPLRDRLYVATEMVAQFNLPTGEATKNFALGDLFDNAELEIVCAVREMILRQVVDELIANENYVVLAAYKNPIFQPDGTILDKDKAHIRLFIMDQQANEAYFLDPSYDPKALDAQTKLIEEVGPAIKQQILEAYTRNAESKKPTSILTEANGEQLVIGEEIIGDATDLEMIVQLNNAALLLDDVNLAKEANKIHTNLVSNLILARKAQETENTSEYNHYKKEAVKYPPLKKLQESMGNEAFDQYFAQLISEGKSLLTEATEASVLDAQDAATQVQALKEREARGESVSLDEWDRTLDELFDTLDFWADNSKYTEDFNLGLGRIMEFLLTNAKQVDQKYATEIARSDGLSRFKFYDTMVKEANKDVAISRGEYQRGDEGMHKYSWEDMYGIFINLVGSDHGYNVVDAAIADFIAQDGTLIGKKHYRALQKRVEDALKRYKQFADPETQARMTDMSIKRAASFARRRYYTTFAYSMHLGVDGKPKAGPQYYASEKGENVAKLYNPFYGDDQQMNAVAYQIVYKGLGMAQAKRLSAGFYPTHNMLTHRHIHLGQLRHDFLTHHGLYRQHKESLSGMSAYNAQKAELENGQKVLLRLRRIGQEVGKINRKDQDFLIIENIKKYFIEHGRDAAELANDSYLQSVVEEELRYLDNKTLGYDPNYRNADGSIGGERHYWDQEILALNAIYNAHGMFDGYWMNSNPQVQMFEKAGNFAFSHGIREKANAADQGKEINSDLYKFIQFGYMRNQDLEIASARIARTATDAAGEIAVLIAGGTPRATFDRFRTVEDAIDQAQRNLSAYTQAEEVAMTAAKENVNAVKNSSSYKQLQTLVESAETVLARKMATETGKSLMEKFQQAKYYYDHTNPAHPSYATITAEYTNAQNNLNTFIQDAQNAFNTAKANLDNDPAYVAAKTAYEAARTAYDTKIGDTTYQGLMDTVELSLKERIKLEKDPAYLAYRKLIDAKRAMEKHRSTMEDQLTQHYAGGNRGMEEHLNRQIAKAQTAITALERAVANPTSSQTVEEAARLSRNAIVNRLRWDQILTVENWLEYHGKTALSGRQNTANAEDIAKAVNRITAMRYLYEAKAEFMFGKSNWGRIKAYSVYNPGTGRGESLKDFTFDREKDSWWEKILDPEAVIEESVNKGHGGRAYVMWNMDDVLRISLDDAKLVEVTANKPGRSSLLEAQAVSEDMKAAKAVMSDPFDQSDKAFRDSIGKNAEYNSRDDEFDQHGRIMDGVIKGVAQALILRNFVPDPFSRLTETLFPGLKPLLGKMSPNFYESSNSEFLRKWIDERVRMGYISEDWGKKLKSKYHVGVAAGSPVYGTSWIMWLVTYLVLHPDVSTGMDVKL